MGVSPNAVGPLLKDVRKTESQYFGYGGLSDLYRGQWTRKPGETLPVAIKVIRRCTWNDKATLERARKRFLRESRVWSQLNHPHVVPFYGLVFEQGHPGLVMPYYKNGDLSHFLRKNPQADRLVLACEVAAGLEYLHNLKPHPVIHGDIKASNVLVTDDHQACLTDFGVAKMLTVSGFTTTTVGGTCRWMAPELLDEREPSPTLGSDIWSFGMTLLQIFTGKLPFGNVRNDAMVVVTLTRGILPSRPPEISDSMWALLEWCWALEPIKRPGISSLSMALSIMTSEELTAADVNDLVDYLENEMDDTEQPFTSLETILLPAAEPSEKPRKKSFNNFIHKLSLGCIPKRGPPSPARLFFSLNTLLKISVGEGQSELQSTTVTMESSGAFCCYWPGCGAHFTTLSLRRVHDIRHWLSWRDSDDGVGSPAPAVPSFSSALA